MEPGSASRKKPVAGPQPPRTVVIVTAAISCVVLLMAALAFIGRQQTDQSQRAAGSSGSPSDAVASVEQLAFPSTAGADLSFAQMRGSPVVVYFYEGEA